MGLGALLSLLFCGMYFCSLQVANGPAKCIEQDNDVCVIFEILIEKQSLMSLGLNYITARSPP